MAIGIGANLAIFTIVNAVLLRPLPLPESDRLVVLRHTAPGLTQLDTLPMSDALYFLYRDNVRTLAGVSLFSDRVVSFTGPDNPERLPAAYVTPSFFEVAGTPPLVGRTFDVSEGPEGPPEAVITHGLWQRRYGGADDIIGRQIEIDGATTEVIGVMPQGFTFSELDSQLWMPLRPDPDEVTLGSFSAGGLARMADGVTLEQVQAELATLTSNLIELFPDEGAAGVLVNAGFAPDIAPARDIVVGDVEATLWILLGAVGFLLLIACANVANLFLARAEARHRELAIRISLGESRRQVVGSTIAESIVLALLGGLVAAPVALAAVRALVRYGPQELPRLAEIAPDANVLAFGVSLSLLAGLWFGLLPALRAAAIPASASLHEGARGASATRERHLTRRALVVTQIALALTLLVGSGLAARSFQRLSSVDPGFDPRDVLTLRLALPEQRYAEDERRLQFHRQAVAELAALPGVTGAAAVSDLPLGGSLSGSGAQIEGRPLEEGGVPPVFMMKNISADYFEVMGIEVVEGRAFERLDADRGAPVVIVSEGLARAHWPGESALGKGIRQGREPGGGEQFFRIVGVVEDVHQQALHEPPPELAYYPLAMPVGDDEVEVGTAMSFVVRTDGTNVASGARGVIRGLDPNLPVSDVDAMDTLLARARAQRAFVMVLLLIASGFAVLLGAIGLYGVISYVVAQRRREIAIRMAIGAQLADIRRMVLTEAGWLALAGTLLGLGGAVALTRRLQALLFETSPMDPTVFATVSFLLAGICLLASWLPARRAARVEPIAALRAE